MNAKGQRKVQSNLHNGLLQMDDRTKIGRDNETTIIDYSYKRQEVVKINDRSRAEDKRQRRTGLCN